MCRTSTIFCNGVLSPVLTYTQTQHKRAKNTKTWTLNSNSDRIVLLCWQICMWRLRCYVYGCRGLYLFIATSHNESQCKEQDFQLNPMDKMFLSVRMRVDDLHKGSPMLVTWSFYWVDLFWLAMEGGGGKRRCGYECRMMHTLHVDDTRRPMAIRFICRRISGCSFKLWSRRRHFKL